VIGLFFFIFFLFDKKLFSNLETKKENKALKTELLNLYISKKMDNNNEILKTEQ